MGAEQRIKKMKQKRNQSELPIDWAIHQKTKQAPASELMKAVAMKAPVKSKIRKDFTPAEQEEIRQKMNEQKQREQEVAENKTEEAKERRRRIVAIKKKAKEMEKGNKSKIILFPSYSRNSDELQWYKLGNFSAMYYAYRMASRMGRTVKVQKDTDKFSKMEAICSVKEIDKFVKLATELNEIERCEETADGFYILYLKKELTDDEVGVLRRTGAMRKEMLHNVLKPKKADAAVYQAILMLDRQILPRISHMEKGYYVAMGDKIVKSVYELTAVYFQFANGYIELAVARERLLNLIEWLLAGTALLGEVEVWGYDVATSIGENINNLKRIVAEMK